MGYYLNNPLLLSLYENETKKPYFVDKTRMLQELLPLVEQGNNHICITRPRRFGKTVMAAMVGAYFSKGFDSSEVFDCLDIAKITGYRDHSDIFAEPERYHTVYGNPLMVNGQEYQTFVVPGCLRITKEAADGLARLKKLGLPVYFVERRPERLCDNAVSVTSMNQDVSEKETPDTIDLDLSIAGDYMVNSIRYKRDRSLQ